MVLSLAVVQILDFEEETMTTVKGSCGCCDLPLIYLAWREEQVVIVVFCQKCRNMTIFDLETMYSALIGEEDEYTRILQNFVPKGKPS